MPKSNDEQVVVSVRVDAELEEQFILAYRKAQAEGWAPPSGDRSEAVRQLMRAMVNDPSIIEKGSTDAELESGEDS